LTRPFTFERRSWKRLATRDLLKVTLQHTERSAKHKGATDRATAKLKDRHPGYQQQRIMPTSLW
ncbi:hypothetical protein AMECASPLE_016747, partial [Ameca splendens]